MGKDIAGDTLLELLSRGLDNHPAIVSSDGVVVTYSSLRKQVGMLACQLRSMGIQQSDRVGIVQPNGVESIISFLAVTIAGTAAPLNPAYTSDEFEFYLDDTNAKGLITSDDVGADARNLIGNDILDIRVSSTSEGLVKFTNENIDDYAQHDIAPSEDDIALVLHTSGTTSRPKRVPLRHRNLIVSVRNIVETYSLTSTDVSLCIMPLFHVHGLVASTLATLYSGGTIVVPPSFSPMGFWQLVKEHDVTWFSAVPTMFQSVLSRTRGKTVAGETKLRFIRSCSAALSPITLKEMEDVSGVPVVEAYGMTEAAHQMASNLLPPGQRVPGSVGQGTGVKIAIMDEEDHLQPTGTIGEVVISGANVIDGYESNAEANASSFVGQWFRTGDRGVLNEEGVLTLQGRLKELINRSGEKISPIEIDEVLLSHECVSEAVAFGVPHSVHGEEPVAAVVLKNDISERELINFCKEKIAAFKVPRKIHIVESIPRTATGKIQRRIVAEVITGKSSQ